MQKIVMDAEAEKSGVTTEALHEQIADSVADPTEEEIASWYAANQSRLQGRGLEAVEGQIHQHLLNERRTQALRNFLEPKFDAMSMRMVLSPPRVELVATRLSRGADDAPVTITTFSDYQCPYCILAEPILDEVLSRYPERVRIVHRHFPLDSIHPFARPAAEASMCADEQGKFWEFHQAIFNLSGKLADGSLAKIGDNLGLDADKLNSCIEERRFKDFVEADFAAGRTAGVTGTPAFYINGVVFSGARDADEMSRQINLELARIEGR
jgi:predicted DsbA family dithiol-disulfide isomerase